MPFVDTFKFESLAQFPIDNPPFPVVSSFLLLSPATAFVYYMVNRFISVYTCLLLVWRIVVPYYLFLPNQN